MIKVLKAVPRYAKAVASAVTTLGATLGVALADDQVTGKEWIGIVAAVLVAAGVVGRVPNKPADDPEVVPGFRR